LLAANIKKVEDRIDELNGRLERRREELQKERQCMIGDIQYLGVAWVLPHPERSSPDISPIVKDDTIERIAVDAVIRHEESRGWKVESVEEENRGFDLISRRYTHIELPSKGHGSYYVYAIECSRGSVYIGQTDNLQDRWEEHISGKGAEWTKHHRPLRLPYYEEYSSREEAVQREKQLKSGSGREWLKETIARALPIGKQTSPGPACRQAGDPSTANEIRFIEVKGRSAVGEVALSTNEYKTAERLRKDYWLYVVFNCLPTGQAGASTPEIHLIQDPVRLGWRPLVKIEHYHVGANTILSAEIAQ
jgi:predicted GIY-YIG superfamily endonuclease